MRRSLRWWTFSPIRKPFAWFETGLQMSLAAPSPQTAVIVPFALISGLYRQPDTVRKLAMTQLFLGNYFFCTPSEKSNSISVLMLSIGVFC